MQHFVYWLFDPQTNELLYIGRSHQPSRRKGDFERLYERKTRLGLLNRFRCFEDAQAHELKMIAKHRPCYNKRIASSPSTLGMKKPPISEETRAKMRAAKLGRKLPEEHKRKIRENAYRDPRPPRRWITNGVKDAHLLKNDPLPEGWHYGRAR